MGGVFTCTESQGWDNRNILLIQESENRNTEWLKERGRVKGKKSSVRLVIKLDRQGDFDDISNWICKGFCWLVRQE